jgi:hypothetical protein
MMAAWDPSNPRACAFRYVFYDSALRETPAGSLAPPPADELARLRAQSRGAADELLWDRADAYNPDPTTLVPVQVTGFAALKARCDAQCAERAVQASKLSQLTAALDELSDRRDVGMRVKLGAYRARHAQLAHRLLTLMGKVEFVRSRRAQHHLSAAAALGGGYSAAAQQGQARYGGGGGGGSELSLSELHLHGQFAALLDDLVNRKALRHRLHSVLARADALVAAEGAGLADAAPLSAATAARLAQVLGQQQQAIQELLAVLQTDARDLAIMQGRGPGA